MNQTKCFPLFTISFMAIAVFALAMPVFALDGQVRIHDPSTLVQCDGVWYTWGTGGTALESEDGWTWRNGTGCPASGAAPDVIHIGDKYFQYISHGTFLWTKSLNPESPDYKWTVEVQRGMWGYENDGDFINPIDPGCFLDPITGKFWLTYGSYFGYTRVIELDPKTGLRVDDKYSDVAVNCEATTMIYHDGYYYILATHGTCCQGANSEYNIRTGRSKSPTGPFVDNTGLDMMLGGGKLVLGSRGREIGAGHFGLIDEGQGIQKFSLHWEADLDRGGASVVDVIPLVWKDGWPVAGENLTEGTYEIESVRHGTALELAVEGRAVGREAGGGGRGGAGMGGGMMGGRGGAGMGGGGGGMFGGSGGVIADQNAAAVMANWPTGNIDTRLAVYSCQAQQKWTISPAEGKGGYLGAPYFKIQIAGTNRALAATEEAELVTLPAYTGSDEQLWRIEQLNDGTWRIMPKVVPGSKEPMALSAIGFSFATLEKFDPSSDKQRWEFKKP